MSKVIRNLHLIPGVSGCGKTTVAKYMARKLEYADMVVGTLRDQLELTRKTV